MFDLTSIWLVPIAYLSGSLSSAVLICRAFSLPDPRQAGSGNPGATNVLRLGGKLPAALTLIGDVAKGLIPVAVGHLFALEALPLTVLAFAAYLGHLYPVFFGFQGGKGVATGLGVLIGLNPLLGGLAAACWLTVAVISRISSLSALVTAALLPPLAWWLLASPASAALLALMSILVFWRHRGNLSRLRAGTEPRIGRKSEPAPKP